jgi:ABC-type amino acid transport substrate-binding protein
MIAHNTRLLSSWLLALIFISMPVGVSIASEAVAAEGRLDRILLTRQLNACIWSGHYGISYRDPNTLAPRGIDVDLLRELGQELGVEVNFIDSSPPQLPQALLSGRCDLGVAPGDLDAAKNGELVLVSPHLASDFYAVVTRRNRLVQAWSDIDRPGIVVAVLRDSAQENVMLRQLGHARLVAFATQDERDLAVESGRADVLITSYPYSQYLTQYTAWARQIAPDQPVHVIPYTWALAPGDDAWFQRVEQFVAAIKRDGRLALAAKHYKLLHIILSPH